MFAATLTQKNKQEQRHRRNSSNQQFDDEDTLMQQKIKNNQTDLKTIQTDNELINFEAYDQEEINPDDAQIFAINKISITEENESQSSRSDLSPKRVGILKKLPIVEDNNTPMMRNSKEEPQAEPMAEPLSIKQQQMFSSIKLSQPEKREKRGTLIMSQNNINPKVDESYSEHDIFSPGRSEQGEPAPNPVDIDDKINKLSQEAAIIDRILPTFVINPYGKFASFWGGLMLVMMIYMYFILLIYYFINFFIRVLILPIRLAFETDPTQLLALDLTIDSIFFTDIVLTFFFAYEDERGIVVIDLKKIAYKYLQGWFVIDLVSTFPLYLILDSPLIEGSGSQNFNSLFRLARLPRIYKLVSVLRLGNIIKHQAIQKLFFFLKLNKEYTLILKFVIVTFIVIHIAGCFWYFVGQIYDPVENWIVYFNLDAASNAELYISSVYYVLTILVTVGYGNIAPVNNLEFIYTIVFEFIGVAFFSYVMGTLTFTFAKLSQKVTMIKEREIFFNELAHTYQLPKETHERLLMSVQNSIFSNSNQILEIYTEEEIFQELPPLVQGLLCEYLFKDIIDRIRILQGKPKGFLRKLFLAMTPVFLNKGDAIYFKGEPADFVYFVIKGRLVTKCEDAKGRIRTLIHVEGSYFGEVDILVSRARGESAIAESQSEVWKISKEQFLKIIYEYEDIKMEILDYAIKKEKSRKSTVKTVKNVKFLELIAKTRKEQVNVPKLQLIQKVKEKMITTLNEIVKTNQSKELFSNADELDNFLDKVQEYQKIKEKLNMTEIFSIRTKHSQFFDQEVEDSLLKGLKVQTHVAEIQEYI